jgi:hypothetical protein
LFSVSEQAIFQDKSFLSSLLAYKTFGLDVFGQGLRPLVLIPTKTGEAISPIPAVQRSVGNGRNNTLLARSNYLGGIRSSWEANLTTQP